jgi:uncharacterized coiled-coil DUF342 family protein
MTAEKGVTFIVGTRKQINKRLAKLQKKRDKIISDLQTKRDRKKPPA